MDALIQNASLVAGFSGILIVLVAFGVGPDGLKSAFPRMKAAQRERLVSVVILLGAVCAMVGMAGAVRHDVPDPCPESQHDGDICF